MRGKARGHHRNNSETRFTPEAVLACAIVEQAIRDVESADPRIADEGWAFLTDSWGTWKNARNDVAGLFMDGDALRRNILKRWPTQPGLRAKREIPTYDCPAWQLVLPLLDHDTPKSVPMIAEALGILQSRTQGGLQALKSKGLAKSLGHDLGWVLVPQTTNTVPSYQEHLAA